MLSDLFHRSLPRSLAAVVAVTAAGQLLAVDSGTTGPHPGDPADTGTGTQAACAADIAPSEGDGLVNELDLFGVLDSFGKVDVDINIVDSTRDAGRIDIDDLFAVLESWGECE